MIVHILTRKEIRIFRVMVLLLFGISLFSLGGQMIARINRMSSVVIGGEAFHQLANAVGVTAGVAPNPLNTALEELRNKERVLLSKEAEILQREKLLRARLDRTSYRENTVFIYSISVSILLFGLIVYNFYSLYRRRKLEHHTIGNPAIFPSAL